MLYRGTAGNSAGPGFVAGLIEEHSEVQDRFGLEEFSSDGLFKIVLRRVVISALDGHQAQSVIRGAVMIVLEV